MENARKKILVTYFEVKSQCLSADFVKRHKNSRQSSGSNGRHLNPGHPKRENAVTSIGTKRRIGGGGVKIQSCVA